MRRFALPLALLAAAALAAAACDRGPSGLDCFESGAVGYPLHAAGDTSATFRWPGSFHPVRYWAEPVAQHAANVDAGLQLWMNAFRCSEMTVVRVTDSAQADVLIYRPTQLPPLPAGAAPYAADSVGACIGRTDVLVDTLNRVERPLRAYIAPQSPDTAAVSACAHFVTAHEIGHTLGLFAHSANPADLMYNVPRRRVLSVDDRFTIQVLYHLPTVGFPPQPR